MQRERERRCLSVKTLHSIGGDVLHTLDTLHLPRHLSVTARGGGVSTAAGGVILHRLDMLHLSAAWDGITGLCALE